MATNAPTVYFHPLVDRDELKASLGLTSEHKVVVCIGRIAVEKNVQALIDAVEHLDESWHAVIIGPQYVPLERLGPRVHLLPARRRIGNWLGIADVLCHPSDYESHCFSINEAWLAGVPVVSCDFLVNRRFEERHGPLMWLVPTRPEPTRLAAAIVADYEGRTDARVAHTREVACREYAAPVLGRRWSDLDSGPTSRSFWGRQEGQFLKFGAISSSSRYQRSLGYESVL